MKAVTVTLLLALLVPCSALWSAAGRVAHRRVPPQSMLAKRRPNAKKRPEARAKPDVARPDFVPMPRLTQLVHRNPSLQTIETDGAKAVVASEHVGAGEVLLVEHVVSGKPEYVLNCVLNDAPLFDVLFPRTTRWSVDRLLADELEPMVIEKVDANGFAAADGTVAIGSAVSAFNHATPPQAVVRSLSLATEDMAIAPRILYVLASADVAPGDEINIEYRDGPSALHPYVQSELKEEAASAVDLQTGAEKARAITVEYTATEAFVNLCVAQDRLYRSLLFDRE